MDRYSIVAGRRMNNARMSAYFTEHCRVPPILLTATLKRLERSALNSGMAHHGSTFLCAMQCYIVRVACVSLYPLASRANEQAHLLGGVFLEWPCLAWRAPMEWMAAARGIEVTS